MSEGPRDLVYFLAAGKEADDGGGHIFAPCRSVDDVMAHVHTFGVVAPEAAGIIQYVFAEVDLRTGVHGGS